MTKKWTVDDVLDFIEESKTQAIGMDGKAITTELVRALLDVIKSRVEKLKEESP